MIYLFLVCLTIVPAVIGQHLYMQRDPATRDALDFFSDYLTGGFIGLIVYVVLSFIVYGWQIVNRLFT